MGFCLFNNVAVACRYAQKKYGLTRMLIVDWDLHHGNGTQDIFYEDPSVFYFSTHQARIYPGTGQAEERGGGSAPGTKLNCPIPAGPGSKEAIFEAFTQKLIPEMKKFRPECVFISAGFDAHKDDPLGQLGLSDADYYELTLLVKEIAKEYSQDRLISVLEGGYNLEALRASALAHVQALRF
jgi:acetoin utilization deacetylase AcuC-like enzyme